MKVIPANRENSLHFHSQEKKGKVHIGLNKPLSTAQDLSLAYSPGVGFPCLEIQKDKTLSYEYTSKGNFVAVVSNGTAVLGYGNLGAAASKPVMEGKSALFKRFADIDSVDIEVETTDADEFVKIVKNIGETWGGINLEDIKAPECFEIESRLKQELGIPVFHDDQHGTAVITLAGLINVAKIRHKDLKKMRVVINGAGAAGISCAKLINAYGVPKEMITMCDTKGVIFKGRTDGMNPWKDNLAIETQSRTLEEAAEGADVLIGLSSKGAFTEKMLSSLAKDPVIFAMANPDPEVTPEEAKRVRPDAIIATGRSDYPNQINNVMCFPYLFRGALDVRATEINLEMQIAAAEAISRLAQESVPNAVKKSYPGRVMTFGPDYIVPTSFDPRLLPTVASEVAKSALATGVARSELHDIELYKHQLSAKLTNFDAVVGNASKLSKGVRRSLLVCQPTEDAIDAAIMLKKHNNSRISIIGNTKEITDMLIKKNVDSANFSILDTSTSGINKYISVAQKLNHGMKAEDCLELIKQNQNMLAKWVIDAGDADMAVSTQKESGKAEGVDVHIISAGNKTIFLLNPINKETKPEELANAVLQVCTFAKSAEITPIVSMSDPTSTNSKLIAEIIRGHKETDLFLTNMLESDTKDSMQSTANGGDVIVFESEKMVRAVVKIFSNFGSANVMDAISIGKQNFIQHVDQNDCASDIFNKIILKTAIEIKKL